MVFIYSLVLATVLSIRAACMVAVRFKQNGLHVHGQNIPITNLGQHNDEVRVKQNAMEVQNDSQQLIEYRPTHDDMALRNTILKAFDGFNKLKVLIPSPIKAKVEEFKQYITPPLKKKCNTDVGSKDAAKCLCFNPSPDPSSLSPIDEREVNHYSFDNVTSNDIYLLSTKLHDDDSISLLVNNAGTMWQYNDMKSGKGVSMVIGGETHMETAFKASTHMGNVSSIISHTDMCSKSSLGESSQIATLPSMITDGNTCGHVDVNNNFPIEMASSMITENDMGFTIKLRKQAHMGESTSTNRDNGRYKIMHFNEGDTFGGVAPPQGSIIEDTRRPHNSIKVRENTRPHDGMICGENMAHGIDDSAGLEAMQLVGNDGRAVTKDEPHVTVTQPTTDLDSQIDAVLCEVRDKQTALTSAVDQIFLAVVAKLQQHHHEQGQGMARTNDEMERHLKEMRDSFASFLAQQHAHMSHLQERKVNLNARCSETMRSGIHNSTEPVTCAFAASKSTEVRWVGSPPKWTRLRGTWTSFKSL